MAARESRRPAMKFTASLYEKLTDEEDARLCDEIGDEACRATPRSFTLILLSHLFTKLGDALVSPKTTLAWATTAVGAPSFVLGFLVPIRESGSMIPQLFIGAAIRKLALRKWVWVAGSIGQFASVLGIGLAVLYLDGAAAGWAILLLVASFSLARASARWQQKTSLARPFQNRNAAS